LQKEICGAFLFECWQMGQPLIWLYHKYRKRNPRKNVTIQVSKFSIQSNLECNERRIEGCGSRMDPWSNRTLRYSFCCATTYSGC
jgi:hypothetical protein